MPQLSVLLMTVQDWSNAMEIKELQDIIQQNGVVGAGGAGFPTYMKLTDKANTILMNCAECEPLLKLHRQLLEKHAYENIPYDPGGGWCF